MQELAKIVNGGLDMIINRQSYLNELILRKNNSLIKVIIIKLLHFVFQLSIKIILGGLYFFLYYIDKNKCIMRKEGYFYEKKRESKKHNRRI